MSARFFNTLTREVEEFRPADPTRVRIYTCGPTVYDFAHIGNFRAYVFEDLLQRHLEFRGYKVERVMNLTDVDDKTIRGCRAAGVALSDFTKRYKEAFFEDLEALRIRRADYFPEATAPEHIARMIGIAPTAQKTVQSIFGYARFQTTARSRISISTNCSLPAGFAMTNMRRSKLGTLLFGKLGMRRTATFGGRVPGAAAGPGGISSAAPWRRKSSVRRSTFIAGERTTFFRTMRPRSRRQSASPACPS
jgi:hypothetical protein